MPNSRNVCIDFRKIMFVLVSMPLEMHNVEINDDRNVVIKAHAAKKTNNCSSNAIEDLFVLLAIRHVGFCKDNLFFN